MTLVAKSDTKTIQDLERLVEDEMTIGSWAEENFGRPNILAVLRRMCDENLEAMEECIVSNPATRTMFQAMRQGLKEMDKYVLPGEELHRKTPIIAEEMADCYIVNCHASKVLNVDLQSYIQRKMEVNRRRKWKQNTDGTGQHIGNIDEDIINATADEEE